MAPLPRVWKTKTKEKREGDQPGSSMASRGGGIRAFGRRGGRGRQDGDGGGLEEAGAWGMNEEE